MFVYLGCKSNAYRTIRCRKLMPLMICCGLAEIVWWSVADSACIPYCLHRQRSAMLYSGVLGHHFWAWFLQSLEGEIKERMILDSQSHCRNWAVG